MKSEKKYEIVIADERLTIVDFIQDKMPGAAVINRELRGWEPKTVFAWHLSLMFQCRDLAANGMPSRAEKRLLDQYGDSLDHLFKGDVKKPNALFLARITWNASRELVYRVYEPDPIHKELTRIIEEKSSPRPFDYRMNDDPEWKLANWHLNTALGGASSRAQRVG